VNLPAPRLAIGRRALLAVPLAACATSGCALRTREASGADVAPAALAVSRSGGVPAATSAAGRLVPGLPPVVPVPPGGRVTMSAIEPRDGGDLVGVSITGTSSLATRDLLAFFGSRLRSAGFTTSGDGLLPAGAAGAAYGRGREFLLVAVVDRGASGGRSWSIGGDVTP